MCLLPLPSAEISPEARVPRMPKQPQSLRWRHTPPRLVPRPLYLGKAVATHCHAICKRLANEVRCGGVRMLDRFRVGSAIQLVFAAMLEDHNSSRRILRDHRPGRIREGFAPDADPGRVSRSIGTGQYPLALEQRGRRLGSRYQQRPGSSESIAAAGLFYRSSAARCLNGV
jgi:hypothetical protein